MTIKRENYRYALSVTSQFPFCGLPLRLDTYSSCQFACRYCFASARGGKRPESALQCSDENVFERRLDRVQNGTVNSVVDELLSKNIPIHLGGMTDPFPPIEQRLKVTLAHLVAAKKFHQPVIISTKSKLVISEEVIRVLEGGPFAVQISLGTIDDKFGGMVDVGAPLPSERFQIMKCLVERGIRVACRIQPVFPGRESEVFEIISACAELGVRHVAVENLKVPVETTWIHKDSMNKAHGFDVVEHFRKRGAKRVGREWVLPIEDRLMLMLDYRKKTHDVGMLFGSADNDLLHFSDGTVCCSGSDLLGLGNGYNYNYLEAIRRRDRNSIISLQSLNDVWRPVGSISQYVNSRSRIVGASMGEYIEDSWNGAMHGSAPLSFFGVEDTGLRDINGFSQYKLSNTAEKLMLS